MYSSVVPVVTTEMDIQAIGDLNSDTFDDIVWRNPSTGENAVWFMNGTTIALGAVLPAVSGVWFNMTGAGDFDADGKADLF